MPISHLLSESFFLQGNQKLEDVGTKGAEQLPFNHNSIRNGTDSRSHRRVQFDEDDQVIFHNHQHNYDHEGRKHEHRQDLYRQDLDEYGEDNDVFEDYVDTRRDLPVNEHPNSFSNDYQNGASRGKLLMGKMKYAHGRSDEKNKMGNSLSLSEENCDNPVLIDTDGGVYDACALMLALRCTIPDKHSPKNLTIVGITTVNGCTTVHNAVKNASRVINSFGKSIPPVPIFKGMDSPLIKPSGYLTKRPSFFGSDGFGDVKSLPEMNSHDIKIQTEHAVDAIIKMAEKYKGKLSILALGPLTNLAMAVKMKPEIRRYVKEIFIVGGNSEGMGNMTVTSEFNFYVDPEAANVVYESFNLCPIYVLPWETSLRSAALSQSFRTNAIGNLDTPQAVLLNSIEQNLLSDMDDNWISPDAALVACFLNREMMRKTEHYHCTVEAQGKHTRGMMVVDKNFLGQHPANVILITDVNRKIFRHVLLWGIGKVTETVRDDGSENSYILNGMENMKLQQDYY